MDKCPSCSQTLAREQVDSGITWRCPSCGGRAIGLAVLRKSVQKDPVNQLWFTAADGHGAPGRACPDCGNTMMEVTITAGQTPEKIEVCKLCELVWFDANEFEALPPLPAAPAAPPEPELPLEAREKIAMVQIQAMEKSYRAHDFDDAPAEGWKVVPALMGMPDEVNNPDPWFFPTFTLCLIGLISVISVYVLLYAPAAIQQFGFIPNQAGRYGGLTFISEFFLHGGYLHLIGNMYFLLIFGHAVEDYLGRWRYGALLLMATVAGGLAHLASNTFSTVPCVGASGGIAGVMACYALAFPTARLAMFYRYRWIQIPAWSYVLGWVVMQVAMSVAQIHGFTNVSAFAHLGGAAIGVACWFIWRKPPPVPGLDAKR